MNKTLVEARDFIDELVTLGVPPEVQAFVLPPHTALAAVRDRLPQTSPLWLGAQNAHWAPEGRGTGEVSMRMVADAGATMVEIGHSERRADFGETDEMVSRKVAAALAHDLVPLVCVGEPVGLTGGDAVAFVLRQVDSALARVAAELVPWVMFAYEPLGAIGDGGVAAVPDEVATVVAVVRAHVQSSGARCGPVLYGGSVDADNAPDLVTQTGVDGLFVGRAGWSAAGFANLLALAAETRRSHPAAEPVEPAGYLSYDPTSRRTRFSLPVRRPA